jgi:hypothetical protein
MGTAHNQILSGYERDGTKPIPTVGGEGVIGNPSGRCLAFGPKKSRVRDPALGKRDRKKSK